ncbi:MAG: hypothetical protein ACQEQC_03270 [Elusimicrobiota bacterium]
MNLKHIKIYCNRIKESILILFFTAVIILTGKAGLIAGPGTTGGEVLNMSPGAGPAALGEAFGARSGQINSTVYNPAGLRWIEGLNFEASHMLYYLDTQMSSVGYGQKIGTLGLGIHVKNFMAEDTARDVIGQKEESFNINFGRYTVAAALPAEEEGQSWGAAVNVITESIYEKSAAAASLDLGWHYKMDDTASAGIVIRNIGQSIKVAGSKVDLPRQGVLAGEYRIGSYNFLSEISVSRQYNFGFRSGIQANMGRYLMLRAGFTYVTAPELTTGFGIDTGRWTLDYSFSPHFDLGMSHRFSLGVKL